MCPVPAPARPAAAATLVVDTLNREVRELTEKFPERKDVAVGGGLEERMRARSALKGLVPTLHEVDAAVQDGRFDEASAGLAEYRAHMPATVAAMQAAQP